MKFKHIYLVVILNIPIILMTHKKIVILPDTNAEKMHIIRKTYLHSSLLSVSEKNDSCQIER